MKRIGVDTGGTFTDLVAIDESGSLRTWKLPSTPPVFEEAVLEGSRLLGEQFGTYDLVHSTTVATNALLEKKGARIALVTTRGFRDVLEIGRQNRPNLYDLMPRRTPPLIPRERRFELTERVGADGSIMQPLVEDEFAALIEDLRSSNVEGVAIGFLFSFLHPAHEQRVGEVLRDAGFQVTLSSDILPEFREFERLSTTVANAYVRPAMTDYLSRLMAGSAEVGASSLRVIQSNGGAMAPQRAAAEAVHTLLSGPAAGLCGALEMARHSDLLPNLKLITFDMGGTSTDVSLLDGQPDVQTSCELEGLPISVPMVDVHTVGAGGGSIASLDPGGGLQVGPESAGANPGPACYGRGERPTVTDANVVLERLHADQFLSGRMTLEPDRAVRAITELAEVASMSLQDCAQGIIDVVNMHMERAIRVISVERGKDADEYTLAGFGGAGGLHVFDLAEGLGMTRVLIPANPGVLSALGAVVAPVQSEQSRTVMLPGSSGSEDELIRICTVLESELREQLTVDGMLKEGVAVGRSRRLDMRYKGQSFELSVPWEGSLDETVLAFHAAHRERYGHADEESSVLIVTARVVLRCKESPLDVPELPARSSADGKLEAVDPSRALWRRNDLLRGDTIAGPATILEDYSTIRIPSGWIITVDRVGNLVGSRSTSTA